MSEQPTTNIKAEGKSVGKRIKTEIRRLAGGWLQVVKCCEGWRGIDSDVLEGPWDEACHVAQTSTTADTVYVPLLLYLLSDFILLFLFMLFIVFL